MVDTKTQRNKSDKETIIDMEPVKEQQKIKAISAPSAK